MGLMAETIVVAARRARMHAEKMLQGVTPAMFARKPAPGGKVIDTNHPAFIYGHLSIYPAAVLRFNGLDPAPAAMPPGYAELFSPGKPCIDDPDGKRYPPMAELTANCFRAYDAAIAAVERQPDAAFAAALPDEHYRKFLPTVGAATLSMLNNHLMMHVGQISAWRRCMGLPAAE